MNLRPELYKNPTLTAELLPHVGAGTGFEPVSKGYEPFKETTPPTCKIIKAHMISPNYHTLLFVPYTITQGSFVNMYTLHQFLYFHYQNCCYCLLFNLYIHFIIHDVRCQLNYSRYPNILSGISFS